MPKSKRNFHVIPLVKEVGGYITVDQAASMVNAASVYQDESGQPAECTPSTINYWLRTDAIEGVRLGDGNTTKVTTTDGKKTMERGDWVVLVSKASVRKHITKLPKDYEARREEARKKNAKASLEDALREQRKRLEEEYRAKIAALDSEQTPTS